MVHTLGTLNCERSSATPDAPLMTPRSASYCELGFIVCKSYVLTVCAITHQDTMQWENLVVFKYLKMLLLMHN